MSVRSEYVVLVCLGYITNTICIFKSRSGRLFGVSVLTEANSIVLHKLKQKDVYITSLSNYQMDDNIKNITISNTLTKSRSS